MDSLVKLLKSLVTKWERKKKNETREELIKLELDLDNFYANYPGGFERGIDKVIVLELEKKKLLLLRQEEEAWRQKSIIDWLVLQIRGNRGILSGILVRKMVM
jgi:hypothetical protein